MVAIIAFGNARGYANGGYHSDIRVGAEVTITADAPGKMAVATPSKAGHLSVMNAGPAELQALINSGEVFLISDYTRARVVERKGEEWIACVRFLDGPYRDRTGWVHVSRMRTGENSTP
jgi:hypothetical protein